MLVNGFLKYNKNRLVSDESKNFKSEQLYMYVNEQTWAIESKVNLNATFETHSICYMLIAATEGKYLRYASGFVIEKEYVKDLGREAINFRIELNKDKSSFYIIPEKDTICVCFNSFNIKRDIRVHQQHIEGTEYNCCRLPKCSTLTDLENIVLSDITAFPDKYHVDAKIIRDKFEDIMVNFND